METPVQSYFSVILRHWKLLAAIILIPTLLVVILVLFILTPVYMGKTTIIFPLKTASSFMRRSLSEMDIPLMGMSRLLDTSATLYNHIAIIESRSLALRVNVFLKTEKGIDLMSTYPELWKDKDLTDDERLYKLAKILQERVHVGDANRGMATVSFLHTDPLTASETSTAYVLETLKFLNDLNRNTQSDLVLFLEARQVEVERDLEFVETDIQFLKEETGILSVEEQARQIISSYSEIETLIAQTEIDYQGSLSMARGMEAAGMDMEDYYDWLAAGESPRDNPPVPAIEALGDATVTALRSQLSDLELARQQALLWATPDNPDVIRLNFELESVRRELYREFSDYYDASVANLIVETSAYQAQLNVAEGILVELDARLQNFPPDERRLIELERDRSVQESIYLVITQELEQARIQEMREEEPYTILDEALVPTKPVRPRKVVTTLGTFMIMFWLGTVFIFWKDNRIRQQAERGR